MGIVSCCFNDPHERRQGGSVDLFEVAWNMVTSLQIYDAFLRTFQDLCNSTGPFLSVFWDFEYQATDSQTPSVLS